MTWRPHKRQLANGKTVWVARFKDERGRVRIAQPAWNGGSGTFELKRDAQRAIDEAARQRLPERASTVGRYVDLWLQAHPRSERTDRTNAGRIRNVWMSSSRACRSPSGTCGSFAGVTRPSLWRRCSQIRGDRLAVHETSSAHSRP